MTTNQQSPLILIVEDEKPIRRFLHACLVDNSYRVNESASGGEALRVAMENVPDLIILDLGLPDIDGQQLLNRLRDWYSGPILVLSAREQEQQKILALDSGADDYVTKPFGTGELLARIRNLLRKKNQEAHDAPIIEFGDVTVDFSMRTVTRSGSPVHLTPLEYKLLLTFIKNHGKVLTHRYLLREVWGPQDSGELHYVRVFVANLRRKLEQDPARPQYIRTEPSVGYRFLIDTDKPS